jgi:hypothetical protein
VCRIEYGSITSGSVVWNAGTNKFEGDVTADGVTHHVQHWYDSGLASFRLQMIRDDWQDGPQGYDTYACGPFSCYFTPSGWYSGSGPPPMTPSHVWFLES